MASKLIELDDGILVEVEVPDNQAEQISAGLAKRVQSSLAQIEPIMTAVIQSIAHVWHEIEEDMEVKQASIELGLGFEGEGNIYVTKAKATSNITVKVEFSPKDSDKE